MGKIPFFLQFFFLVIVRCAKSMVVLLFTLDPAFNEFDYYGDNLNL